MKTNTNTELETIRQRIMFFTNEPNDKMEYDGIDSTIHADEIVSLIDQYVHQKTIEARIDTAVHIITNCKERNYVNDFGGYVEFISHNKIVQYKNELRASLNTEGGE